MQDKLPDPMTEDDLSQKLRALIDDWIADLAKQYEQATPRLQKTMEENATSDEEWETLLTQIHQIYNTYTTNKIIEELEQFHNWIGTRPEYQNITTHTLQRYWDLHHKEGLLSKALNHRKDLGQ